MTFTETGTATVTVPYPGAYSIDNAGVTVTETHVEENATIYVDRTS